VRSESILECRFCAKPQAPCSRRHSLKSHVQHVELFACMMLKLAEAVVEMHMVRECERGSGLMTSLLTVL
jgi:hypothetical protein